RHVAAHVRHRGGREPAGWHVAGMARLPDHSRHPAQEPVRHVMADIRPILSTLRRHKTAAALIVLEVALSCAIICNAVFLINDRMQRMDQPSGLAESEIVRLQLAGIGRGDNAEALSREDVAALSAIPGVKSVALTNQLPFGNSSWNSSVNLAAEQQIPNLNAATYLGDEQLLETLGLRLVAGRDFTPD